MTTIRRKVPLNSSKFLWKSAEHNGKRLVVDVDTPLKEPDKTPVEFDLKYLKNYFNAKVHNFETMNVKSQNLISPGQKISAVNLAQVEQIKQILADNNHLQLSDFQIFSNVSILSLRYNTLHHIETSSSYSGFNVEKNFKCLSRLDLSHNNLESSSLIGLNQLQSLRELKLNYNRIKFFTDANNLNQLSRLVRLELCSNGIESCKIFHQLSSLTSLQELLLNNNHLQCVPLLLRSETAEKVSQLSSMEDKVDNVDNLSGCDHTFEDSECSTSTLDSEKTCFLLRNVYHPQTPDVLSTFLPRTLSTLYELSEHDTSCSSDHRTVTSEASSLVSDELLDDVIPICHVPFPRLHTLHIKFNQFRTESSILGASLWPNMKALYIRGNHLADNFNVFDIFAKFNVVVHYN